MCDYYNLESSRAEKIKVIYPGFDAEDFVKFNYTNILEKINIKSKKYLLTVGRIELKKNFETILKSFADLKNIYPGLKLVFAGKPGLGFEKFKIVCENLKLKVKYSNFQNLKIINPTDKNKSTNPPSQNSLSQNQNGDYDVVVTGYVSDDDLKTLYQNARCMVHSSLLEGFGFTVLEAFAFGLPVACSNTTSLPEVAGQGALYFEPTNINQCTNQIKEIMQWEQNNLAQHQFKALNMFSWQKTTEELVREILI